MFSKKFINILNEIDTFIENNNGNVWFRGINNNTFTLNSGLFRLNLSTIDDYLNLEKKYYTLFKSNCSTINNYSSNNLDLLYTMQHHGVKTRLLDWSESLSVALFFASLNWTNSIPCRIWALNPIELNRISINKNHIISPEEYSLDDVFNLNSTIAIYPIRNNSRIIAQHGVFTIQGNKQTPLENEFNLKLLELNYLKSFDFTLDMKEDILKYISLNGVNTFSLFPDLDGLSNYLNNILLKHSWL